MKPIVFHFEAGQVIKERTEKELKAMGMHSVLALGGGKLFSVIRRIKSGNFHILTLSEKNGEEQKLCYWDERRFVPEWYNGNTLSVPDQKSTIGLSKTIGETKHAAYYSTGIVDKSHIEGAKYDFMKKYGLKNFDGIEYIIIENLKCAPDGFIIEPASKIEKAILEASGHPSRFAMSLLMAYKHIL